MSDAVAPVSPRRRDVWTDPAVVVGCSVLAFALAQLAITPMLAVSRLADEGPQRAATAAAMALALAAQLAGLALIHDGDRERVPVLIPNIGRYATPLAAALVVPLAHLNSWSTLTSAEWLWAFIPVIAASSAAGTAVASFAQRLLRAALIRRANQNPTQTSSGTIRRGTLPGNFGGLFFQIALAAAISGAGLLAVAAPTLMDAYGNLYGGVLLASLLTMVLTPAVAGRFLGDGPGSALTTIARRLDALGYDTRNPVAWPIRVTSFDQLGRSFYELERLRRRLGDEVELYQAALDRTQQAERAKSEFLATVSHELRTPLNAICGYTQLLLEGTAGPLTEAQREDVQLISAGGNKLLELITDILDMSMIESGELRLVFAPFDLSATINEVVRSHRPLVRDRPVELRSQIDELPSLVGDRKRVSQVLTNLVSNAIKFTERGHVTVRARLLPAGSGVLVEVSDSGIGIAPEDLSDIFEEYRQVGNNKRRIKGTGLGLAIARSIASVHGGAMHVSSVVGEGSTFSLELPLDARQGANEDPISPARLTQSGRIVPKAFRGEGDAR